MSRFSIVDSRSKRAISVLCMSLALFSIAGVLAYKYVKASDYVCYYGTYAPGSYEAIVGLGPTGHPTQDSMFINGSWTNPDDIKCIKISEDNFTCPSKYSGGMKKLGVQYVTDKNIQPFLTNNT